MMFSTKAVAVNEVNLLKRQRKRSIVRTLAKRNGSVAECKFCGRPFFVLWTGVSPFSLWKTFRFP